MTTYRIYGRGDGHDYGSWEGESPEEALAAMYKEAGYDGPVDLTRWIVEPEAEEVDLGMWHGRHAKLTTASPTSSYGQPVLRLENDDGVIDYGPLDLVSSEGFAGLLTAQALVMQLVAESEDELTLQQESLVRAFCGPSGAF